MEIPIFPLNGAVLFPGTSLPLNIFEKRYLEMVDYALSKERCIGMIQSDKKNKLYNIGCIGKIHSFSETTDGRYLISLQGTNCFKVKKELEKKYKFRLVEAEMLVFEEDKKIIDEKQKNNLLDKYSQYIKVKKINLNLEEIQNIDLILEISDKYFSMKQYENGMDLLLKNYPKNKDSIRNKMVEFFDVLGNTDQITIQYRKKLSQLMFS